MLLCSHHYHHLQNFLIFPETLSPFNTEAPPPATAPTPYILSP